MTATALTVNVVQCVASRKNAPRSLIRYSCMAGTPLQIILHSYYLSTDTDMMSVLYARFFIFIFAYYFKFTRNTASKQLTVTCKGLRCCLSSFFFFLFLLLFQSSTFPSLSVHFFMYFCYQLKKKGTIGGRGSSEQKISFWHSSLVSTQIYLFKILRLKNVHVFLKTNKGFVVLILIGFDRFVAHPPKYKIQHLWLCDTTVTSCNLQQRFHSFTLFSDVVEAEKRLSRKLK